MLGVHNIFGRKFEVNIGKFLKILIIEYHDDGEFSLLFRSENRLPHQPGFTRWSWHPYRCKVVACFGVFTEKQVRSSLISSSLGTWQYRFERTGPDEENLPMIVSNRMNLSELVGNPNDGEYYLIFAINPKCRFFLIVLQPYSCPEKTKNEVTSQNKKTKKECEKLHVSLLIPE